MTYAVIIGGIQRIGSVAEFLVPIMCIIYVMGGLMVILFQISEVPAAFALIFKSAFSGHAAVGGFAGAGVAQALRYGVARGIFSNEAGLGTASIAHGAAKVREPVRQGTIAMKPGGPLAEGVSDPGHDIRVPHHVLGQMLFELEELLGVGHEESLDGNLNLFRNDLGDGFAVDDSAASSTDPGTG